MSKAWLLGRVTRNGEKMVEGDNSVIMTLSCDRPHGSDLEPRPERGSATIVHDPGIGCKAILWQNVSTDGKDVSFENVDDVLNSEDRTNPADKRGRYIGDTQVLGETAVRCKDGKDGGEIVKHRIRLRVAFDPTQPFQTCALGLLRRSKAFVLSLSQAEVELPAMPAKKPVVRTPKDVAQLRLVEKDDGQSTAPPEVSEADAATMDAMAATGAGDDLAAAVADAPPHPAVLPEESESMMDKASKAKRRGKAPVEDLPDYSFLTDDALRGLLFGPEQTTKAAERKAVVAELDRRGVPMRTDEEAAAAQA